MDIIATLIVRHYRHVERDAEEKLSQQRGIAKA